MCFLLDSRLTNSFMTLKTMKWLGVKTKLVAYPITLHLAQGIVKPLFNIMISGKLFCERFQFLENILCDLNNFHVIVLNTFLDAYKVDPPPSSLMDSTKESKGEDNKKIKRVGACSLAHNTSRVEGHAKALRWGLRRLISKLFTHIDLYKPNDKLVNA